VKSMQWILFTSLVLGTACAKETSSQSEVLQRQGANIIDGTQVFTRVTPAAKSVVYLEYYNKDNEVICYCSGALIAPNFVLTAGHCFDERVIPNVKGFNVVFESHRIDFGPRTVRSGVEYEVHPLYNSIVAKPRLYDHDIALAMFGGDMPAGFAPVAIDTDTNANYSNEQIYVYGYGRASDYKGDASDYDSGAYGYLRRGVMKVDEKYSETPDRYFISPLSPTFLCQGDSGGPQFYDKDKTLKIIGVNSAAIGAFLPNGKQKCKGISQATKVAPMSSWIFDEQKKMLKQLN